VDLLSLPISGRLRDLHPIDNAHAEHTNKGGEALPRYSVGQISFGYLLGDYFVIAKMIPELEIN